MYVTLYAVATTREELQSLLDALVRANVAWLRAHPETPKLYDSGVRYRRELLRLDHKGRREDWLQIPYVLDRRVGDCEDLASWRTAELIVGGDANARDDLERQPSGGWHVVTLHGDGRREDPSARLGMATP